MLFVLFLLEKNQISFFKNKKKKYHIFTIHGGQNFNHSKLKIIWLNILFIYFRYISPITVKTTNIMSSTYMVKSKQSLF